MMSIHGQAEEIGVKSFKLGVTPHLLPQSEALSPDFFHQYALIGFLDDSYVIKFYVDWPGCLQMLCNVTLFILDSPSLSN